MQDNQIGDATAFAVAQEERRRAAKLQNVGKHEPKLSENGIPADVLEKLLPVMTLLNWKSQSLMVDYSIALLSDPLTLFPVVVP